MSEWKGDVEGHEGPVQALPVVVRSVPEAVRAEPPVSWNAAARRLWRRCRPLEGTQAEAYLRARGLGDCRLPALRFHPALAYRAGQWEQAGGDSTGREVNLSQAVAKERLRNQSRTPER